MDIHYEHLPKILNRIDVWALCRLLQNLGLVSFGIDHCLVWRPSDHLRPKAAYYPSKFQHNYLFSWCHAPKQGSLCLRPTAPQHDAPTNLFNCGNCVLRVEGLSLSSPNINNIYVPKEFSLVSSDQSTDFKNSSLPYKCSQANLSLFVMCRSLSKGVLLRRWPRSSWNLVLMTKPRFSFLQNLSPCTWQWCNVPQFETLWNAWKWQYSLPPYQWASTIFFLSSRHISFVFGMVSKSSPSQCVQVPCSLESFYADWMLKCDLKADWLKQNSRQNAT